MQVLKDTNETAKWIRNNFCGLRRPSLTVTDTESWWHCTVQFHASCDTEGLAAALVKQDSARQRRPMMQVAMEGLQQLAGIRRRLLQHLSQPGFDWRLRNHHRC